MCLSIKIIRPECVLAEGEHLGFKWTVVHNGMGYRCGYIRVPKNHPWHGKGYDDINADVHGGLTFAEKDVPCGQGELDDGYWVGFDCAHCRDAQDPTLPCDKDIKMFNLGSIVRTQKYVENECRELCKQASTIKDN